MSACDGMTRPVFPYWLRITGGLAKWPPATGILGEPWYDADVNWRLQNLQLQMLDRLVGRLYCAAARRAENAARHLGVETRLVRQVWTGCREPALLRPAYALIAAAYRFRSSEVGQLPLPFEQGSRYEDHLRNSWQHFYQKELSEILSDDHMSIAILSAAEQDESEWRDAAAEILRTGLAVRYGDLMEANAWLAYLRAVEVRIRSDRVCISVGGSGDSRGRWQDCMRGADAMDAAEKYRAALQARDPIEAHALLQALISEASQRRRIDAVRAERLVKATMAWQAYEDGPSARACVERLYGCAHPVYGTITESGPPAKLLALALAGFGLRSRAEPVLRTLGSLAAQGRFPVTSN